MFARLVRMLLHTYWSAQIMIFVTNEYNFLIQ